MLIRVCYTGHYSDHFADVTWWRLMDLPALPPKGSNFWFPPPHDEWDSLFLEVESIVWVNYQVHDENGWVGYIVNVEDDFTDQYLSPENLVYLHEGLLADGWHPGEYTIAAYNRAKEAKNAND